MTTKQNIGSQDQVMDEINMFCNCIKSVIPGIIARPIYGNQDAYIEIRGSLELGYFSEHDCKILNRFGIAINGGNIHHVSTRRRKKMWSVFLQFHETKDIAEKIITKMVVERMGVTL